jgi:hypothetical protein
MVGLLSYLVSLPRGWAFILSVDPLQGLEIGTTITYRPPLHLLCKVWRWLPERWTVRLDVVVAASVIGMLFINGGKRQRDYIRRQQQEQPKGWV